MRILMVNKFLHPNGGSETYLFKLGACLQSMGHEVQYFGMEHEGRMVGNRVGAYTAKIDFHSCSGSEKLICGVKTIYSSEARKKIRLVLEDFRPDVVHLNNFNYQLTPSILPEIRKWERQTGSRCQIIYTAHDYQLICPNHMCHNPNTHENCEKCRNGHFMNCVFGRCIHGSAARSIVGAMEALFWNKVGVYKTLDRIICCSRFMKTKLDENPVLAEKTLVIHNFADTPVQKKTEKGDYVLYFGRYSREKGIAALIQAAKELPQIPFVFAGSGPLGSLSEGIPNIKNVGFQSGEALKTLIREARFTLCPSEWYENCPLSVMESLACGTPVLGARIGGIPELIRPGKNGELFESGNTMDLKRKIEEMWLAGPYRDIEPEAFDTVEDYCHKLLNIYRGA